MVKSKVKSSIGIHHNRPSIEQQRVLMKQIVDKIHTQHRYPEGSVFMKKINTQKLWSFELGTQEGINVPIWNYTAFQQSDRQHDQSWNNDTFVRLLVTSAHCVIGTEKYPDVGILSNYDDDHYSEGYGQIKEVFRALTNDSILQPYISEIVFRLSSVRDDGKESGYNIHAFDIRYQKNFENAQPINVEFKFDGVIPGGIYGYALVLTNRLVRKSPDGQRMFDSV